MREKIINTFFTSDFTVLVLTDKVIVQKIGSGIAAHFSGEIVREYDYSSPEDISGILSDVSRTMNPQPADKWSLGLPLKYFTLVSFSLPGAALDNLSEAVRYSLMRHVPYDLDQAMVSHKADENGDFLDISAVIIPRQSLEPFLNAAGSAGITFWGVFPSLAYWSRIMGDGIYASRRPGYGEALVFQDNKILLQTWAASKKDDDVHFLEETSRLLANIPDLPATVYLWEFFGSHKDISDKLSIAQDRIKTIGSGPEPVQGRNSGYVGGYEINLMPKSVLRQKKMASYMVYAGIILFILSLFVLPISKLAGQKRHLTKIESRVERMSVSAEELSRLREESRQIMDSIETMTEMKESYPSSINILRELTEVIPETAWAVSLNYSNKKITIQGEAESATSVIEAIENSPMFREVRFSAPVTKSGPRDRFSLEAEVVS